MESAKELKEKGNACMKEGKHMEAIIHYTHALHSDASSPQIYSNRSLAFLKEQQHFFALEDSKKVMQLDPSWFKGYLRKADVEFSCHRYSDAVKTCQEGINAQNGLNVDNEQLQDCLRKCQRAEEQLQLQENRYPVLGIGTGVVVGILIVFGDELLNTEGPYLENLILKLLVVFILGFLGKAIAELYKYSQTWSRDQYLAPPADIFGSGDFSKGFFPDKNASTEERSPKKRSKKD